MHRFLFYKEFQMLKTKVLNVTMDGIASTASTFYKTAKVIEDIQSCWFKKKVTGSLVEKDRPTIQIDATSTLSPNLR